MSAWGGGGTTTDEKAEEKKSALSCRVDLFYIYVFFFPPWFCPCKDTCMNMYVPCIFLYI